MINQKKLKLSKENSIFLTEESKRMNEKLKKVAIYDEYPYGRVIRKEKDDIIFYNTIKEVEKLYDIYKEYIERLLKEFHDAIDDEKTDFFATDDCLIAKEGREKELEELLEMVRITTFYVEDCSDIIEDTKSSILRIERNMNKDK